MNLLTNAILTAIVLQRLVELALSRRNVARLKAVGGVEFGQTHYRVLFLLYCGWLAGLWALAWDIAPDMWLLALYLALQLFRVWVLLSLGEHWTTRIVVVPGETLVASGPYRVLKHPYYVLVVLEILVLPLTFGLWFYALPSAALAAATLAWRVRVEDAALATAIRPLGRPLMRRKPRRGVRA